MLCLPKTESDKLRSALQKGEFTIGDLYEMTSEQRNTLLTKYVGKELGSFVNGEFEKAIVSNQKNALSKWVEKTFDPKKPELKNGALKKIDAIKDVLNPKEGEDFLKDLVANKLGINLTVDEGKTIVAKAEELRKLAPQIGADGKITNIDKFGLPTKEYLVARRNMEKYIQEIDPVSSVRAFAQGIGRNMLLFSLHTPLKSIESNIMDTLFEGLARRTSALQFNGENTDLVKEYTKTALSNFNASEYNVSTMQSLNDDRLFGEKSMHLEGGGKVHQVARMVNDLVITKMHGAPYVVSSAFNFADSVNLNSTILAKEEGLTGDALKKRSRELFLDATALDPQTEEGKALRTQAQADAARTTFVNESFGSRTSAAIKGLMNNVTGDLRLGDWIVPIAKIPANVISRGIELAGADFIKSGWQFKNAYQEYKATGNKNAFKVPVRTAVTAGLGMAMAYLISANVSNDHFIGAYPTTPNEIDLMKLNGGIANSIKIGNHWINLEYFGPLGPVISGFMYAKKYGNGGLSDIQQYGSGLLSGVENLPGLKEFTSIADSIQTKAQGGANTEVNAGKAGSSFLNFIESRTVPAFVLDSIKVFKPAGPTDIFGNPEGKPSAIQQYLFGSAVSKSNQGPILTELNRLQNVGKTTGVSVLPSLTDIEKFPKTAVLKSVLTPDKYAEAINQFKINFRINVGDLMNNQYKSPTGKKTGQIINYANATDAQKGAMINQVKTDTLNGIFTAYGQDPKMTVTGKNIFEGQTSPAGEPTLEMLQKTDPNDGTIRGYNPNNEPIYNRAPLSYTEPIRKELYASDSYWRDNGYSLSDVQLDHIVPVSAGGTNSKNNLELINNVSNQLNHPFELYVVEKYKNGTMTREEVIQASLDYKINKTVSLTDIKNGKY